MAPQTLSLPTLPRARHPRLGPARWILGGLAVSTIAATASSSGAVSARQSAMALSSAMCSVAMAKVYLKRAARLAASIR